MLKTFGKEGKKEKKLAIDNEEFGEIGDAPPGDEAPRGRNKIYIEVKRIIDQKNKEYWSEDKVKKNLPRRMFLSKYWKFIKKNVYILVCLSYNKLEMHCDQQF